jgi:hypothetical protein
VVQDTELTAISAGRSPAARTDAAAPETPQARAALPEPPRPGHYRVRSLSSTVRIFVFEYMSTSTGARRPKPKRLHDVPT